MATNFSSWNLLNTAQLNCTGPVSGGALSCTSLTDSGTASTGALTVAGTLSNGTNSMTTGAITSSGNFTCGTRSLTCGACSTGALTSTSVTSTGSASVGSLTCTSISSTGSAQVGSLACSSINSTSFLNFGDAKITQTGSNTGGVSINSASGIITMFGALNSGASADFKVTNTNVVAGSVVLATVGQAGALDSAVLPIVSVNQITNASFYLTVTNTGGSNSTNPMVVCFLVC